MNPIEFEGHNTVYAKDQPEYLPLPVFKSKTGEVTSCWRLTWVERLQVLFFGRVYITILTFNKPLQPLRPSVDWSIEDTQDRIEARQTLAQMMSNYKEEIKIDETTGEIKINEPYKRTGEMPQTNQ